MRPLRIAIGLPVAGLLVFAALVGCSGGAPSPTAQPSATRAVALRPPPPEPVAAVVLREWDARRAAAYAEASARDLRRLYLKGAGRADVRVLRGYLARGLVVTGIRMQVLALMVLESSDDRLRLQVTDRLVGAVARGPEGEQALPRDSPTTRVLELRQVEGEWLMASVTGP